MAGMSQRRELQTAHSTKFLNYGHLGTVTYDEEDKSWQTLRIVDPQLAVHHPGTKRHASTAFPLRHLSSKVVCAGRVESHHRFHVGCTENDLDHVDKSSTETRASQTEAKIEDKLGTFKSARSGTSTSVEKVSPNLATRLAFGSAISTKQDAVRSEYAHIPIAASVSGSNAQHVRLVRVGRQVTNDPDICGADAILHLPYVSGEDQACWISNGGPIQQVCFAAPDGYASTWMAARLESSTTIFHPLLHRKRVAPGYELFQVPFQAPLFSALDANPIATIPLSRTGGHPHADVNFHPQDHRRFGLIDEHGNWSVWLVDGEHQGSPQSQFRVTLSCSGKIWTWDHEKRFRESLPYHDGWHRILWFVRPDTPTDELFICNRRIAARYTASGDLIGLEDLRLGHVRENQSILDVQVSNLIPGCYFVLTSTRLFWLGFKETQNGNQDKNTAAQHVLLAWQHFRDRGDRTLHLVLLEAGLSTLVLIVSKLNNLVLAFRVGFANGHDNHPLSLADPLPIFLPGLSYRSDSVEKSVSQLFRPVECRREVQGSAETVSPTLFKLFSLYEDLTIVEHLCASTEPDFGLVAGAAQLHFLHLPVPTSLGNPKSKSKSRRRRDLEDFVVPDGWVESNVSLTVAESEARFGDPSWKRLRAQAQPRIDWQDVYTQLTDEVSTVALGARTRVGTILSQFSDHLRLSRPPGIPLLSEMLSCKLHITDVDENSDQIDELIITFTPEQILEQRLQRLPIIRSEAQAINRLTSIYEAIVATHLTPLSPVAPDRTRVNKERLARRVAADLLLASIAIYPTFSAPTDLVNDVTVADRANSKTTPESSGTPSASIPSSLPDSLPVTTATASTEGEEDDDDQEVNPILTRLRKYTTISTLSSSSLSNPTLSSILRHLPASPHTNPETYTYRATERALANEAEEELALAAGQADPRARRKAERARLARVRREEIRKNRLAVEELKSIQSRGPPRVLSTQTGGGEGVREVQSSQVRGAPGWDVAGGGGPSQGYESGPGLGQEVPMSQPERGVFGTRPGMPGFGPARKKDKGKKRAAGF